MKTGKAFKDIRISISGIIILYLIATI
jgi:hypothetical protein